MEIKEQKEIVANRVTEMESKPNLPTIQSPMEIISQAVARGAGEKELAIIERMFAFDVKVKEQQAKEAHFSAMAKFHETVPPIIKDKLNTQFKSKYSSVENILNTCRPHLAAQGLYVKFRDPVQTEGSMSLSIVVSHSLGHEEVIPMTIPIVSAPIGKQSGQAAMNPSQAIKATFTYLRGALLEAALGMAGSDATLDDDGNSYGDVEPINDQQFADITALIKEVGAKEVPFCKYLKIKSIDAMPSTMYERAVKELERKRK